MSVFLSTNILHTDPPAVIHPVLITSFLFGNETQQESASLLQPSARGKQVCGRVRLGLRDIRSKWVFSNQKTFDFF